MFTQTDAVLAVSPVVVTLAFGVEPLPLSLLGRVRRPKNITGHLLPVP